MQTKPVPPTHVAMRKSRQVVILQAGKQVVNTSQAATGATQLRSTLAHWSHCPFEATGKLTSGVGQQR